MPKVRFWPKANITSASDTRLTRCLRMSGWCKCSFSAGGPRSLPGDRRENPSSMQAQLRLPHGCSACDHYYRLASPARPTDIQHRLRLHQLDLRHSVAESLLCFQLTGEIGRPALGFSSNAPSTPTYSMYSGFWTVALTASPDEIFFTSFEAC
jgi:hypothetical protein